MLRSIPLLLSTVTALVLASVISSTAVLMARNTIEEPANTSRISKAVKTEKSADAEQERKPTVRVVYAGYWQADESKNQSNKTVALPQDNGAPSSSVSSPQTISQPLVSQRSAKREPLVNLNTATVEELNAISGGGMIGKAIFRGRPYQSSEELVSKRIVTRARFEQIRGQVIAVKS